MACPRAAHKSGTAGAFGRHNSTPNSVAFGSAAFSTELVVALARAAHIPLIERPKAMQVPSILQGESRTRLLQGIAIGAVASMVIGFSWGGWVTGGTADKIADERANAAVLAALTPICVEKFLQNSDAKANLASPAKDLFELGTRPVLGEGRLGDTARSYFPRLPLSQGVCREVAPGQNSRPMN